MCGPWEIGAYYEPTPKLVEDRLLQRAIEIPFDVRADTAVLCAKAVKRFNRYLLQPQHFKDETPTFLEFARFAYLQPNYGDFGLLATFDVAVGKQALDHGPYLKKITSPLRILALAGEGLIP
jgi:hypothetical protein